MNPETGLPELPNGAYYSVRARNVQIYEPLPDTSWIVGDYYWEYDPGSTVYTSEHRPSTRTRKVWWWFKEIRYPVTECRYIKRSRLVVDVQAESRVTSTNLIELAEEAKKEYLSTLETRKLVGDYPPKKFEGGK